MPGNQVLQMGLFAKNIIILFLSFLEKTPPSLLCTLSFSHPHATELWKHLETFPPCNCSGGVQARASQAPASRYLLNGAVLPIGELVPAANSKERDKDLVTPQQWLFQSSSALWAGALAGPGVLQMCLRSLHCPFPPLASPLQSYIILQLQLQYFHFSLYP